MTPSMSVRAIPASPISPVNQTAYSSAVRLALVAIRHAPRLVSPSNTPNTVVVLLELITSSMARRTLSRPEEHVARGDPSAPVGGVEQQAAVGVEIGEHALDRRRADAHARRRTESVRARAPRRANRREA